MMYLRIVVDGEHELFAAGQLPGLRQWRDAFLSMYPTTSRIRWAFTKEPR